MTPASRRAAVAATWCVGTALLRRSLASRPGSREFYVSTSAVAGVWVAGSALGPRRPLPGRELQHPVRTPLAVAGGSFAVFYAGAHVARRIPALDDWIGRVLAYAAEGDARLVLVTTLANGVGEELFFRGAWYDVLGGPAPVVSSTVAHAVASSATRNPALALAAVVMGGLFGLERRASGGVRAPLVTHLTWSALMLRLVTPLFRTERPLSPGAARTRAAGSRRGARSRRRSGRRSAPARGTSA